MSVAFRSVWACNSSWAPVQPGLIGVWCGLVWFSQAEVGTLHRPPSVPTSVSRIFTLAELLAFYRHACERASACMCPFLRRRLVSGCYWWAARLLCADWPSFYPPPPQRLCRGCSVLEEQRGKEHRGREEEPSVNWRKQSLGSLF